ncbi:protamine-like [Eupeodes corollae]|uniref:protamine-like n=1 Tax=Eupeodes corollae TaxID=290404 RepID=UPI0024929A4C|nr:protamine-like [Eupeodes corollae]
MSEIKKKESKVQTKKRAVSDNESEFSSDERDSEDESPIRSRTPSKRKVTNLEQKDDLGLQPSDASRRRRGGRSRRRGRRSRSRRRSGRRSSRSRRRR